jgi:hypothetical protein
MMTLEELAFLCDIQLDVVYRPVLGCWQARFPGGEIKRQGMLESPMGVGDDPISALRDYLPKIRGQILVFNAYDDSNRKEYHIPTTLWVTLNGGRNGE